MSKAATVYSKKDLVDDLSSEFEMTKKQADEVVSFIFTTLGKKARKSEVRVAPYLTMEVSKRAARTGRNPRTGEPVKIAAKKVLKLRALGGLKGLVE